MPSKRANLNRNTSSVEDDGAREVAKNIESLAKKLGAIVVCTVPDFSAGAFGIAALANTSSYFQLATPTKKKSRG